MNRTGIDAAHHDAALPGARCGLFLLGVIGVLTRRNVVIVLMSIELILNAVNLNLVAFSACGEVQAGIRNFCDHRRCGGSRGRTRNSDRLLP